LTAVVYLFNFSNFHFLQKASFFKPSRFFPLHFFLLQMEGLMAFKVGKNFAYRWIITLEKAKLE